MFRNFIRDEQGMETVEWAIMAALIVVGLILTITAVGANVKNAFVKLQSATAN